MSIVSGSLVFFLIWWMALFTVLPFSLVRDEQGRPDDPKMKEKFIKTTLLAVLLWGVAYVVIDSNIIDFRAIAEHMAQEGSS